MSLSRISSISFEARGFTLLELAIVLIIVALLLGAFAVPLSTQVELRRVNETQEFLEDAKEALIGFAVANGRLPCPASATSNGREDIVGGAPDLPGGGACTKPHDGFLPLVTLGLPNADGQGYAIDAWGSEDNRIRYAVTTACNDAFTTAPGTPGNPCNPVPGTLNSMKGVQLPNLAPNLTVCASGATITATGCGGGVILTANSPAVIFSLGKNAPLGTNASARPDEFANQNGDRVFVSHQPCGRADCLGGEFDDILTWISPNVLYSRMVAAGRLP